MEKLCRACGETKAFTEFHKDSSKTDGLNAYCKPCTIARQRVYQTRPPRYLSPPGMKRCSRCKQIKPVEEFHKKSGQYDGLDRRCKACSKDLNTIWRLKNLERAATWQRQWRAEHRERSADHSLKANYGLPLGSYDKMLTEQGGRCAICGTDTPGGKGRFHVDHCHTTQKIRGLLCGDCNLGIGKLKHDESILLSAINYLRKSLAEG